MRVERRPDTHGYGQIGLLVANIKTRHDRNVASLEYSVHYFDNLTHIATMIKCTQSDGLYTFETPSHLHLGQHAVDPVRCFVCFFQYQNTFPEIRRKRRSQEMAQGGQVATDNNS